MQKQLWVFRRSSWSLSVVFFAFVAGLFIQISDRLMAQQGADGGKFDGAIWTFQMIPHDKNLEKRSGMFRVNGLDLYQRSDMNKPGFDRKVGQKVHYAAQRNREGKVVGKERTTVKFTDLQSDGRKYTGMSGTLEVTKSKPGEWSGRFVDGNGLHWDFRCSRKQE